MDNDTHNQLTPAAGDLIIVGHGEGAGYQQICGILVEGHRSSATGDTRYKVLLCNNSEYNCSFIHPALPPAAIAPKPAGAFLVSDADMRQFRNA